MRKTKAEKEAAKLLKSNAIADSTSNLFQGASDANKVRDSDRFWTAFAHVWLGFGEGSYDASHVLSDFGLIRCERWLCEKGLDEERLW